MPYYAPLFAKAGSTLQMGMASTGLRSYLAVGGGIVTLPVLGSRATDLKCCIGGLDGRKLTKGDTLPTGLCDTTAFMAKNHHLPSGPPLARYVYHHRSASRAHTWYANFSVAARRARPAGMPLLPPLACTSLPMVCTSDS